MLGTAVYGADLQTVQPAPGGEVNVQWSGSGDGLTLLRKTSLNDATWTAIGGPDQWPSADNSWTGALQGPSGFFQVRDTPRGTRISATPSTSYPSYLIGPFLNQAGIFSITPQYSVNTYKIVYRTYDHRGHSIQASGMLCVPAGVTTVPMVSYQHPTIFEREDAPSGSNSGDLIFGVAMASEGYAVVLADYLGLGMESPPLHPFVHARSEAIACVDMLRAGMDYLSTLSIAHNGKLFLIGYSQGGHATLALQKEIEQRHSSEFSITASAPMAGPHDLSGTMRTMMLSDAPYSSPSYVAYLLFGNNQIYHFFNTASDILVAPYASTLPPLMDGAHSSGQVEAAMPSIPKQIFTADFMSAFESDPNHPFRQALVNNNTYGWTPSVKTRFYHCAGDTVVPLANSQVAYSNFVARGASEISIADPNPALDHNAGAQPCFEAAKSWFDTMK